MSDTAPAPDAEAITIRGAREHNLKNLSVAIPRGEFVVITGVSGSGKSTLAFDLLFAEGQRRFLDSMNAYARQFVEQLSRPEVDLIAGLPPTVSIEQRNSRGGGKSTVATITELQHFVRLLFARLGIQHCPRCHVAVEPQTRDEVARRLTTEARQRGDLVLLAPVVRGRKGFHSEVAEWAARHGYVQIRADGRMYRTDQPFRLDRFREHHVEIVTGILQPARAGRACASAGADRRRLIEETLDLGHGTLFALDGRDRSSVHSTERTCPSCGQSFQPLDPKLFSYNSPAGWCPKCRGFGELFYLPEDVDRGARADAIEESWFGWMEGKREACPECQGARLNPLARSVRLHVGRWCGPRSPGSARRRIGGHGAGWTLVDFGNATVEDALGWVKSVRLQGREGRIARDILPEIRERLRFLDEVGLGYLQLGRAVTTLSGGESQRIRLAAQLGSNLSGVLYVLDEPTIGLHARDNQQLLEALDRLKARGNSLVVVEHDEQTMRRADHVIDLGPGAGQHGGQVVATGSLAELMAHAESITGQCLRARCRFPTRGDRRPVQPPAGRRHAGAVPERWIELEGAAVHNLRNLTIRIPLGRLVLVTGVSGSGKSTLVRECLLPALMERLRTGRKRAQRGRTETAGDTPGDGLPGRGQIRGYEPIGAVFEVDQSPIGRTPRSTPATYVGFFDEIRRLFSLVPEARLRGYGPGRFSFNSTQGRCPGCEGAGVVKLEMNFLPPAFVRCETCNGLRFDPETLDIEYNGRNIAQVLDLSVAEAIEFFAAVPRIRQPLEALRDTGLDYLRLGQTSPTLSGGEAQRVKLVTHLLTGLKQQLPLLQVQERRNLFILEEPTIGLHIADVRRLVEVVQRLVDAGHTVLIIEHNLDVIAEADWVIDLGPEGGAGGGRVVAEGTPEDVARSPHSHTGAFLRRVLSRK